MQYCRGLSFSADPDYKYILGLFESCCDRYKYDLKTPDFLWNKNRLFLEREALKQSVGRVVGKTKKDEQEVQSDEAAE